jgi:hypothetical protein
MKAKGGISALFEFNSTGNLKTICLNAESQEDQKILEKGLAKLFKPNCIEWIRRLFQK